MPRSLSDAQESAQLLTGLDLPFSCLSSLIQGAEIKGHVGLINLSPYDGCLESACARWHLRGGNTTKIRTFTIGFDLEPMAFSEKVLGTTFMQDSCFLNFKTE